MLKFEEIFLLRNLNWWWDTPVERRRKREEGAVDKSHVQLEWASGYDPVAVKRWQSWAVFCVGMHAPLSQTWDLPWINILYHGGTMLPVAVRAVISPWEKPQGSLRHLLITSSYDFSRKLCRRKDQKWRSVILNLFEASHCLNLLQYVAGWDSMRNQSFSLNWINEELDVSLTSRWVHTSTIAFFFSTMKSVLVV